MQARQAFEFSQQAKQSGYLKAAKTGSGQPDPVSVKRSMGVLLECGFLYLQALEL